MLVSFIFWLPWHDMSLGHWWWAQGRCMGGQFGPFCSGWIGSFALGITITPIGRISLEAFWGLKGVSDRFARRRWTGMRILFAFFKVWGIDWLDSQFLSQPAKISECRGEISCVVVFLFHSFFLSCCTLHSKTYIILKPQVAATFVSALETCKKILVRWYLRNYNIRERMANRFEVPSSVGKCFRTVAMTDFQYRSRVTQMVYFPLISWFPKG